MTEEEKESIEQLKSWREYIIKHKETVNKANDIEFYLRTALNLIQKQDTEINKLNNVIDKIKWKPIKEYDRKKYDWVLVKYFDGDYECVPEVAEQRSDGKWYTSEKQIHFEVKYFFDMQILDEERRGEYE